MSYRVSSQGLDNLELCSTDTLTIALQSVYSVLATKKGSVPMDRGYGLSPDLLDSMSTEASALVVSEVKDAIESRVPNVSVTGVEVDYDGDDGVAVVTVEVEVEEDEQ